MKDSEALQERPVFYLSERTIYKRPVTRKVEGGERITIGFPVCTASEYVDPHDVLKIFNESAS